MLIPFPFALWTSGVLFDVLAHFTGRWWLHFVAYYAILLGCIGAVIAAIPGLIDLLTATGSGSAARRTGWTHAILNILALVCFAISVMRRTTYHRGILAAAYWSEFVGLALIAVSGWLGGSLVYDHKVGVPNEETR
jgi:uncharacterized membrane protein